MQRLGWGRWSLGVVLVGYVLLLASGHTAHARQATLPAGMLNVTWNLVAIERVPLQNVENTTGTGITIVFNADGLANGSGGCNSYSTQYTAGSGNSITFGPAASTRMFCQPQAVMDLEREYFTALSGVTGYQLDGSILNLTYNNGQSRLGFIIAGGTAPGMPRTGDGGAFLPLVAILAVLGILSGLLIRRHLKGSAM
jgi:heat shock protein HslJ